METNYVPLKELLVNKYGLVIPDWQRPYEWEVSWRAPA
jgi:uncharacterized protein with ParB-like and HNH nuclease domain